MTTIIEREHTSELVLHHGGVIAMVRLDTMFVDPRFQRPLNEGRVERICREFDPDFLGPLTVSRHDDGQHSLLDGQHRWHALVNLNMDETWCEVLVGLSPEREAEIFFGRNAAGQRSGLTSGAAFRARIAKNDPIAVDIEKIVQDSGFTLELRLGKGLRSSRDVIGAVGDLEVVYRWGREFLVRTLWVIKHAWAGVDAFVAYGPIIVGVAAFMKLYPEASDDEIAKKLTNFTVARILAEARSASMIAHTPQWITTTEVILNAYNRSKRSQTLPRRPIPKYAKRNWMVVAQK